MYYQAKFTYLLAIYILLNDFDYKQPKRCDQIICCIFS